MPRSFRVKSLTNVYHVMIRGVNKEIIFYDNEDRRKFLQILKYYQGKYEIELFSYCLMDNHVHILIKAKENFNKFMQCIQTVYALYFNKKYKRVGHLFQDRFKSIPVEEEKYLLECVRYIHQNPVKAKISSIESYKWSSYNEYIKKSKIVDTDYILSFFSKNKELAINEYKKYMSIINKEADIKNLNIEDKLSDKEAKEFIEDFLKIKLCDIKNLNIVDRNIILSKIISFNFLNLLQISRITEINRNILRKVKGNQKGSDPFWF